MNSKGEARITSLLIGILFIGLLMSTIGFFIGEMNDLNKDYASYSSLEYNESKLDRYNKLEEIRNITSDISGNVQDVEPGTQSEQDVIGSFFTNAYASVKTFFISSTYTYELTENTFVDIAEAGGNSVITENARLVVQTILVIVFIIGIGLYIIFKVKV